MGANVRGIKRANDGGGESLTDSFCNLSLGLEMDWAVHSHCKVSASLNLLKFLQILHDARTKIKVEKIHFNVISYLLYNQL